MDSKKRNLIREFITFNIVGILNTVITFLIYSGLVFIGIHYKLSLIFDYCFGIVFSFFLNKSFTFQHTGLVTFQMVIFMIGSYLAVFAVNLFLLTILVEKFNFNKYAAQAMALSVSAGLSFFVQKFFIFHKKDGETGY